MSTGKDNDDGKDDTATTARMTGKEGEDNRQG